MGKRVLRDRSTLRPPSDEPPIKRPPPKPVKTRGSISFEDLPPKFYNLILEKMSLEEFKQFNYGSRFAARICEEFEKRDCFPLEELPPEFHSIVVEKMPFGDFKQFNLGSKLTVKICEEFEMRDGPFDLEMMPRTVYFSLVEKLPFKDLTMFNLGSRLTKEMCEQLREIEAPVRKIYIRQREEIFLMGKRKKHLDLVPDNVRLLANALRVVKKDLTAIKKFEIRAHKVEFYGETGTDLEFVKDVLMLTRPQKLFFDSTSMEILKLQELKKMNSVEFDPWFEFNDSDLLALDFEDLSVGVRGGVVRGGHVPVVTSEGILQLLQEWKAGTRKFKKIQMVFDKRLILDQFPGHQHFPAQPMVLCKADGENDCVIEYIGYLLKMTEIKRE